jgi:hypothetical protein
MLPRQEVIAFAAFPVLVLMGLAVGVDGAVGEPVFAAKPDGGVDDGWLITQVLDGATQKSFFAIFDAATVGAGPIAKVMSCFWMLIRYSFCRGVRPCRSFFRVISAGEGTAACAAP